MADAPCYLEINALSERFYVRRLHENDVDLIYDLSCENKLFYQYHPPFVTKESILEDMSALPPGKSCEDKYYIGFFEDAFLVAVMDLILDYPTEKIAFIGLFMTNILYQHKGIGSEIIADVARHLRSIGYREIRLGVDRGNPQSYSFWSKNGFSVTGGKEYILMGRTL